MLEIEYVIINVVVCLVVLAAFMLFMVYAEASSFDWDEVKYTFTHDYPIAAALFTVVLLISHFITRNFLG